MQEEITLGPLEKEILEIVWKKDQLAVRQVLLDLNQTRSNSDKLAYTTVMTIMKRLVDKSVLVRKKSGRSFLYTAKKAKPQFVKLVVKQTIQSLVDRFGEPAIAAFVDEVDHLSPAERHELVKKLRS